ncbi:hypothetical protein KFL_000120530 [Klebsormidium nitens]|uniref:SGNH hydrolase-type esterase domain-containing protein n=1 Tax=Klebsormidium nitens TaxID=105231 RepID=A0A1Y1HPA3_KLENI|nr:hypothetical protein KFL_000120530 [Klebsormidium nitens]|eukprot:GAQ78407.1 hypothetical protein KFL_000120530 [Klebsormidium nitens]
MSDLQNAAHAWATGHPPAPQGLDQLDWTRRLEDVSSLRKRDRPMSFDAEGCNQFAWGEQLLADLPPKVGTWTPPKTNVNRQESVIANSTDNAELLAGLQLQEGLTLAPRHGSPAQAGAQAGVNLWRAVASFPVVRVHTLTSSGSSRSDAQNGGVAVQAEETPSDKLPESRGSLEAETTALQAPVVDRIEKEKGKERETGKEKEKVEQGKEKDVGKRIEQAALRVAQALGGEIDEGLPVYRPEGQNGAILGEGTDLGGSLLPAGLGDVAGFDWPVNDGFGAGGLGTEVYSRDASPDLLTGPDLWIPDFTDWLADFDGSSGVGEGTLVTPRSVAESNDPLLGPTVGPEVAPPTPPQPLHRLWAELLPAQLRSDKYRTFRTTYKEEVRRLRIWTATYIGESFLPLVADLHFDACNALPAARHRQARLMFTKGLLWASFVSHVLENASPPDLYFMRRNSELGPAVGPIKKLLNFSAAMRHCALTLAFLLEDRASNLGATFCCMTRRQRPQSVRTYGALHKSAGDEAAYGPEVYRTYGALHKSAGVHRPLAFAGYGYHQISFPKLTDPEPPLLETGATPASDEVELIEFEDEPLFNKCIFQKNPFAFRWGTFWFNEKRLEATGKGLARAGARGRQLVQGLTELTLSSHVKRFDCMAAGGTPSLEKYLAFARYTSGVTTALGLAFCAIGQELGDSAQWTPTEPGLEGLFDAAEGALALAGGVFRIMSDVRTYEADLVQCRLNAVAIWMREALCSHKEAIDYLVAKVADDIESLEAEIVSRAPKDRFSRICRRPVYLALGDSYAAGVGSTDNYVKSSLECKRSPVAWPELLAKRLNVQLTSLACNGAQSGNVYDQLSLLSAGYLNVTEVVLLSVGGNDAGFGDVLKECVLFDPSVQLVSGPGGGGFRFGDAPCKLDAASEFIANKLPRRLSLLYKVLRSVAPNARVLVTGYPRLFTNVSCDSRLFLTDQETTGLNRLANELADVIKLSMVDMPRFQFVDTRNAFEGHAVCAKDPWINDVTSEKIGSFPYVRGSDESYHPNVKGQNAYEQIVYSCLSGGACK